MTEQPEHEPAPLTLHRLPHDDELLALYALLMKAKPGATVVWVTANGDTRTVMIVE